MNAAISIFASGGTIAIARAHQNQYSKPMSGSPYAT